MTILFRLSRVTCVENERIHALWNCCTDIFVTDKIIFNDQSFCVGAPTKRTLPGGLIVEDLKIGGGPQAASGKKV